MEPTTGVIGLMAAKGIQVSPELSTFQCFQSLSRTPPEDHILQYMEVIQRHHKRTPYASNIFFKEDVEWTCIGSGPTFGGTRYVSCLKEFNHQSTYPDPVQIGTSPLFNGRLSRIHPTPGPLPLDQVSSIVRLATFL